MLPPRLIQRGVHLLLAILVSLAGVPAHVLAGGSSCSAANCKCCLTGGDCCQSGCCQGKVSLATLDSPADLPSCCQSAAPAEAKPAPCCRLPVASTATCCESTADSPVRPCCMAERAIAQREVATATRPAPQATGESTLTALAGGCQCSSVPAVQPPVTLTSGPSRRDLCTAPLALESPAAHPPHVKPTGTVRPWDHALPPTTAGPLHALNCVWQI